MTHLRYLRYVVLHKWYVLRAGLLVGPPEGSTTLDARLRAWVPWLWRLLVHDLSKFRPSEWRPYATYFYGSGDIAEARARFNGAWLMHIHRNPHHWQHWILHEDSGKTLVLLPPAVIAREMVCDWLAAGTKILNRPSMAQCVAETIVWYARNHTVIQLRDLPRRAVELVLTELAAQYGLDAEAEQVYAAREQRVYLAVSTHLDSLAPHH